MLSIKKSFKTTVLIFLQSKLKGILKTHVDKKALKTMDLIYLFSQSKLKGISGK